MSLERRLARNIDSETRNEASGFFVRTRVTDYFSNSERVETREWVFADRKEAAEKFDRSHRVTTRLKTAASIISLPLASAGAMIVGKGILGKDFTDIGIGISLIINGIGVKYVEEKANERSQIVANALTAIRR